MYSKIEVVEMLISIQNQTMSLVDSSKKFVIDYENEVVNTVQKRVLFGTKVISTYSFDSCILEANGKLKEK